MSTREARRQRRHEDHHDRKNTEIRLRRCMHQVRDVGQDQIRYQSPKPEDKGKTRDRQDESTRENEKLAFHGPPFEGMPLAWMHWHHDPGSGEGL